MNVALTSLAAAASALTVQVPLPEHAPDHPANVQPPGAGVGLSVTLVPVSKDAEQADGQAIPAGLLRTVPLPERLTLMVPFPTETCGWGPGGCGPGGLCGDWEFPTVVIDGAAGGVSMGRIWMVTGVGDGSADAATVSDKLLPLAGRLKVIVENVCPSTWPSAILVRRLRE